MPGNEELLARLQQLENGYYGDKEAARQKNFFDTYGSRFSNNRGIGLAILNELDARGIDTSAADEAVQEILDTLRTECNEIIESIKEVQQDAIQNAQKVEAIQNAVSDVVAGNPDTSVGGEPPVMENSEVPPSPALDEINTEEGPMPQPPVDTGTSEPPAKEPAESEPATPPADEGSTETEPSAEEPDPTKVSSDERLKNIRSTLSSIRAKRKTAPAASKSTNTSSFKPSSGMIEAASRGY